ncbi:MAG TPA: M48 family metalloprotease [Anaerolineales bacterium]|nr:M48 family metalloprotease [Anaerolineales bacterium]
MIRHIGSSQILVFLATVLIFFLSGCAGNTAAAVPQPLPTRDPGLEQSLERQLGQMSGEAVPIYEEATQSLDAGDYQKSMALYQQVIALAPNFSTAYRRLGYIELSLRNIAEAEQLSRKALSLETNSYNQSSLAMVLLEKNTPKDSQEAYDLASASVGSLPDDEQANTALLLSAAAVNNLAVIRQTNEHLLRIDPGNPLGHYFAGLLAANDGRWEKAEAELLNSQKLGMAPAAVQHALDQGIARNAMISRTLRWGSIACVIWLLGFGILFAAGTSLSRATLQALNNFDPAISFQIQPQEHRIRSMYRAVIAILSSYFYISMPFVLMILFLLVGGLFYLFFLIGSIPIQFALILVIMLFTSLAAVLRSLFIRTKDVPPGRSLERIDAPELWKFVGDIAHKLDVRPVDAIYVVPWVTVAVYETGSILQKMRGTGKRNLILGVGALRGLTQGQLAAILAHEYGHFSNHDTAGGDLAHQVRASLHQLAQRLIQSRATQIFNPLWLFVLGYQRVFLRVALGASRLQEVLADRYAAMAYGSQSFIDGLRNIIWQTIAFPMQADHEIRRSFDLHQPVHDLYDLPLDPKLQGELNRKFEDAIERTTSAYDSHPAPHERIAWIERLHSPHFSLADEQLPALDIVPDPEALKIEMTGQLMKNVRRSTK